MPPGNGVLYFLTNDFLKQLFLRSTVHQYQNEEINLTNKEWSNPHQKSILKMSSLTIQKWSEYYVHLLHNHLCKKEGKDETRLTTSALFLFAYLNNQGIVKNQSSDKSKVKHMETWNWFLEVLAHLFLITEHQYAEVILLRKKYWVMSSGRYLFCN